MLTRYAALVFTILAFATSARAENAANSDIDLDFSIVTGLTGGPTSYLDGINEMHWVLAVTNKCGLDEQHLRASAKSTFTKSKLGFVSSEEAPPEYFFDRPLFRIATRTGARTRITFLPRPRRSIAAPLAVAAGAALVSGYLLHRRWCPCAVEDRRIAFIRPVHSQHQDELACRCGQPVTFLLWSGAVFLDVQVS